MTGFFITGNSNTGMKNGIAQGKDDDEQVQEHYTRTFKSMNTLFQSSVQQEIYIVQVT